MKGLLILVITVFFNFSLGGDEGFDRKDCQWQARDLRTMAFRFKNISWEIERKCRQNTSKGKRICGEAIRYFEELLGEINKQHKVTKDRCIK